MLSIILMAIISSKESMNNNSYIAFFDLDRTIIKAVSGRELAFGAFKKKLLSWYDIANAIFLSIAYKLKLRDPLTTVEKMITWVKGLSEETFNILCNDVFYDVLLPSVYSEVIPEIEMHRKNNAKTVILSSSVSQVCREAAIHLSMDDFICSRMEVVNGYLTGYPEGRLCYGEEKKTRLMEYCEKNDNIPEESWYYADSISDYPVLSIVGHPVCVNPDKELIKKALDYGWKICKWK